MKCKEKLSRSIRKFIRKEKGRIYREFFDLEKQKKAIEELYKKFIKIKKEKIIKNPEIK
jgi:hypothetical protein